MSNPYIDLKISDNEIFRFFTGYEDEWDLVWHRDERDRKVVVQEANGWKMQFDNELPFDLKDHDNVYVKSMEYHRLLKGWGPLKLLIQEY